MDVLGMPYLNARIQWSRFVIFTAVIFLVANFTHSVMAVVETRLLVSTLFIPSIILAVRKPTKVPASDYFWAMWRAFAAAGVMALAIWGLNTILPFQGVVRLILDVLVGAGSFVGSLLLLWDLSGRPQSAEQDIIAMLGKARATLTRLRPLPQAAD